jgi:hypothetical protein
MLVVRGCGLLLLLASSVSLLSGCSNSKPTGTVVGKVTYNGQPVPEGTLVTFLSNAGYAALGTVDAAGDYKLIMAGSPDVPVASYLVSVAYIGYDGPAMTDEEERLFNSGDPATLAKFSKGTTKKAPFSEKYGDPILSGLTFDIQVGPNTYDIDLK